MSNGTIFQNKQAFKLIVLCWFGIVQIGCEKDSGIQFSCSSGNCVELIDGTYKTLTECENACGSSIIIAQGEGLTDSDGNEYSSIVIGSQEWMSENLRVNRYLNGDTIFHYSESIDWIQAEFFETGAWCHYDNNELFEDTYGKLYNWYTVRMKEEFAQMAGMFLVMKNG